MYKSGMSFDIASQARYIDPILCPTRVNRGQKESSTKYRDFRNTKWMVEGSSSISNLACTHKINMGLIVAPNTHLDLIYDTHLRSVVPGIYHTDDITLCALEQCNSRPENTLPTASSITGDKSGVSKALW
jgi:hypothetical protein